MTTVDEQKGKVVPVL